MIINTRPLGISWAPHETISQQTPDSWAETDTIAISKHCNDVRIDSACRELLQSRFARHTFLQHEIWLDQIKWKCDGLSSLEAV